MFFFTCFCKVTNLHLASLQNWAMGGTPGKKRPSISPKDSEQSGYYARGQSFVRQDAFQRALETLRLNCGCIWTLLEPFPTVQTDQLILTHPAKPHLWGLMIMMRKKDIPLPNPISNKPPEIRWFPTPSSKVVLYSIATENDALDSKSASFIQLSGDFEGS